MIKEVKKEGKKVFKSNFWKVVAVCFITAIMTGSATVYFVNFNTVYNNSIISNGDILHIKNNSEIISDFTDSLIKVKDKANNYLETATEGFIATFLNNISKSNSIVFGILNAVNEMVFKDRFTSSIIIFIGVLIKICCWLFISNVIKVGKSRFFLENRRYKKTKLRRILFAYEDKKYKNVAFVMFKKELYTFLWSFTIIGGIIKYYSYYFIPYILAENPDIKFKDAVKLSKRMTCGYKKKMFLLDVYFGLYYIFGILSFNIFNLLVTIPYRECSYTEFYMNIRNNYIKNKDEGYLNLCLSKLNVDICNSEYPIECKVNSKKIVVDNVKYNFWDLILLFFTFSFIGYLWEVLLHLFSDGVFVNRGSLYGPWLPIYGCGGIISFLLLYKYRDKPVKVFFMSVLVCGLIEYFSSLFMELIFDLRWWDYTGYFFNINGRVCLEGLLFFGFGCTVAIYILIPFLLNLFHKCNIKFIKLFDIFLVIIFLIDFGLYLFKGPNKGQDITNEVLTFINHECKILYYF